MAAYVFGTLVLLLLWDVGLARVMAFVTPRFMLTPHLALVYRAIGLAAGYVLAVLMTELVLPHSRLSSTWTLEQMQAVTHYTYILGGLLVAGLFVLSYRRLLPSLPKVAKPSPANPAAAKPRLKSVGPSGRDPQKRRA